MKKSILIILLIAAGFIPATGQQTFNYDSLSILRVLLYGLESNYDIRIKRQIVGGSQGQVQASKGAFNPDLSLSGYGFYGTDPTVTFFDSYYVSGQLVVPTRFGAKFYTGFKLSTMTEIISGVPNYYPSTNMPINESGMWAGVTMPLLRNFGRNNSNNVSLRAAMMMNQAQNISFSDEICVFIKSTLSSYYNSYQRLRVFKILSNAEKDAKEYLSAIQTMIDDEQIPKSEIFRAKAYETNINQQFSQSKNEINKSLYDLVTSVGGAGNISLNAYPGFSIRFPIRQPSPGRAMQIIFTGMLIRSLPGPIILKVRNLPPVQARSR